MFTRQISAGFALVLVAMLMGTSAAADAGDLDSAFSGDGIVTTGIVPHETSGAKAVAILPDGDIVAVGGTQGPERERFALARYDSDGRLDAIFGEDGKVATAFHARRCVLADAVAVQSNGKIVVAGIAGCRGAFALARYLPNGHLDALFGGDGRVTARFGSGRRYAEAFDLVIQSDGKIVAVGTCCGSSFLALARYDATGTLDPTFGGDGKVTTDISGGSDLASAVALQPNGKIIVAGAAAKDANAARFAVARYRSSGHLDPTFGGDGIVTTQPSDCVSDARSVAVQADGRIVAAGAAGCIDEFALARYDATGHPDPTFGGDGTVTANLGCPQADANDVAIQADGRIVASGFVACEGTSDVEFGITTARFEEDGDLDPTFGAGGSVSTSVWDSACFQEASGVAVQGDGRIVAAGGYACGSPRHTRFTLIRYLGS